jgi:hypothetical protein
MKQAFITWKPNVKSKILLNHIIDILDLYEKQGYKLTLRQLYYQLVSRDVISNTVKSYNIIGNLVNNARLAGYIDWDMIEDRSRHFSKNSHWDSPSQIIEAAARGYYKNKWENQVNYIEVWCEKDAISNIIEPVCSKYDVLFMANRGYSSQSAMYEAYQRLLQQQQYGKNISIIYLGDHDPSGIDMTRDIIDRIGLFLYGEECEFEGMERIALNMDQIRKYDPPENPAKMTDTRFRTYEEKYGTSSWELDALEPSVLSELVENKISGYIDFDLLDDIEKIEKNEKLQIQKVADDFRKKQS